MFAKIVIGVVILTVLAYEPAMGKTMKQEKKKVSRRSAPTEIFHKRQVVCTDSQFACSNYSCTSKDSVCDTLQDCYNGKDEQNCPTDCSGPHQFKCQSDSKCISHKRVCDGTADCLDWSDEANCLEFECLAGTTHCVGGHLECIPESYRCDGEFDCHDKSDEANCPQDHTSCFSFQFHCTSGSRGCVPQSYKCDGDKDCTDGSDEAGCSCASNQFQCANGGCVPSSWKCDGDDDCGDLSDETGNCPEAPDYQCDDVLTAVDCMLMNQTSHPICEVAADGHRLCRKFCGVCSSN
ncbi:very low-density lipoprotein receptor [Aplysia californica]|uniref:Very low-density lipoprotein receptor n=1 Tax=Aplysia californica TaxID=6500 RepID=A0ABM1A5J9_APLCA|nr:very low-density lipoprotein receptor [Aplysia californica]